VEQALDVGVTFLDMASEHGASREEELFGKALGRRCSDVVIATKVGAGDSWAFGRTERLCREPTPPGEDCRAGGSESLW
jgi:aryl-alcohol dehydrogenase-like predicted oxidoreductase